MVYWLVVSTYPSEKYDFVSWDDDIPNIWKIIVDVGYKPTSTIHSMGKGGRFGKLLIIYHLPTGCFSLGEPKHIHQPNSGTLSDIYEFKSHVISSLLFL